MAGKHITQSASHTFITDHVKPQPKTGIKGFIHKALSKKKPKHEKESITEIPAMKKAAFLGDTGSGRQTTTTIQMMANMVNEPEYIDLIFTMNANFAMTHDIAATLHHEKVNKPLFVFNHMCKPLIAEGMPVGAHSHQSSFLCSAETVSEFIGIDLKGTFANKDDIALAISNSEHSPELKFQAMRKFIELDEAMLLEMHADNRLGHNPLSHDNSVTLVQLFDETVADNNPIGASFDKSLNDIAFDFYLSIYSQKAKETGQKLRVTFFTQYNNISTYLADKIFADVCPDAYLLSADYEDYAKTTDGVDEDLFRIFGEDNIFLMKRDPVSDDSIERDYKIDISSYSGLNPGEYKLSSSPTAKQFAYWVMTSLGIDEVYFNHANMMSFADVRQEYEDQEDALFQEIIESDGPEIEDESIDHNEPDPEADLTIDDDLFGDDDGLDFELPSPPAKEIEEDTNIRESISSEAPEVEPESITTEQDQDN